MGENPLLPWVGDRLVQKVRPRPEEAHGGWATANPVHDCAEITLLSLPPTVWRVGGLHFQRYNWLRMIRHVVHTA